MRNLLLLAPLMLLLGASPLPPRTALVGEYELTGVREAAGGLQLLPDGTFRWVFIYGALDEQSAGRWRVEGDRVLLTTEPKPRPPSFAAAGAEAGDPKLFALRLETVDGRPIQGFRVTIRMADGSKEEGQTSNDWLEAELDGRTPVSVQFEVPMFKTLSPLFAVDLAQAQRYRFRFDPADLGTRAFQDWPLEWRGGLLIPPDAPDGQGLRRVKPER